MDQVTIECDVIYPGVSWVWSWDSTTPLYYKIQVIDFDTDECQNFTISGQETSFYITCHSKGHCYRFNIAAYGQPAFYDQSVLMDMIRVDVKSEFSVDQLRALCDLAMRHNINKCLTAFPMLPIDFLYRNKPREYFERVKQNDGIEEKYMKDENGDECNNINSQLEGLFFSASVNPYINSPSFGKPLTSSVFGDTRLLLPVDYFLDEISNLFFADFYCMGVTEATMHWVTLVHTRKGSEADHYCANKLLRLNMCDNPFLCFTDGRFWVTTGVWLEVLHTEDVDHNMVEYLGGYFEKTSMRQSNRHGGKYKNAECPECNIMIDRFSCF